MNLHHYWAYIKKLLLLTGAHIVYYIYTLKGNLHIVIKNYINFADVLLNCLDFNITKKSIISSLGYE